jgi:hypothetical protein
LPPTLFIGVAATLAVLIASRSFGRIAGISTAAACGASMAFFTMEPAFSFEVASPFDRGTLFMYVLTSLLLLLRSPKQDRVLLERLAWPAKQTVKVSRTALAELLEAAVSRAWPEGIEIDVDRGMQVACSPHRIEPVLRAVMRAGVPDLLPTRIAAYGADTPGQSRIWLALQYKAWPVEPHVVHIGKNTDQCPRLEIPNCPDCAVTWFDNGFERVFQISIPAIYSPR